MASLLLAAAIGIATGAAIGLAVVATLYLLLVYFKRFDDANR